MLRATWNGRLVQKYAHVYSASGTMDQLALIATSPGEPTGLALNFMWPGIRAFILFCLRDLRICGFRKKPEPC